jgi:chromosome segregation ATPase
MSKHSLTWASLHNKLSHAKKSLSVLKKEIEILTQSNFHLLKKNTAWAKSYNTLLEATTVKDQALKRSEEKISYWKNRYAALESKKCILECDVSTLTQEIDALRDTVSELRSLTTPFSSEGISAEDYLGSRE